MSADARPDLRMLAEPGHLAVPPSHRPVIGPLVTGAKRLLLTRLEPLHQALLRDQAELNHALIGVLEQAERSSAFDPAQAAALLSRAETNDLRRAEALQGKGRVAHWYGRAVTLLGSHPLGRQQRWNVAAAR